MTLAKHLPRTVCAQDSQIYNMIEGHVVCLAWVAIIIIIMSHLSVFVVVVVVFSVYTAGLHVHSHQNRCQRNRVDGVL